MLQDMSLICFAKLALLPPRGHKEINICNFKNLTGIDFGIHSVKKLASEYGSISVLFQQHERLGRFSCVYMYMYMYSDTSQVQTGDTEHSMDKFWNSDLQHHH